MFYRSLINNNIHIVTVSRQDDWSLNVTLNTLANKANQTNLNSLTLTLRLAVATATDFTTISFQIVSALWRAWYVVSINCLWTGFLLISTAAYRVRNRNSDGGRPSPPWIQAATAWKQTSKCLRTHGFSSVLLCSETKNWKWNGTKKQFTNFQPILLLKKICSPSKSSISCSSFFYCLWQRPDDDAVATGLSQQSFSHPNIQKFHWSFSTASGRERRRINTKDFSYNLWSPPLTAEMSH